jgi:phospholipid/cholesterol/gamma-HCH transport system substrate-binding protein
MEARREQALVGLFVIVAAVVLVATVFGITGAFGHTAKSFRAFFPFAGGLEVGSTVRYAGGPKVGRVSKLEMHSDLPVKTDSHVRIMSMSPLGDNHLEIVPGTPQASLAQNGATLPSDRYLDLNAITERINDLAPEAQKLLQTLNDRATEMKVTIARVNDLLNDRNRENLAGTLAETRGMTTVTDLTGRLDQTLEVNSENIDEMLENFRHVSQNLKEFTEIIKARPYTLLRASSPREHKTGEPR